MTTTNTQRPCLHTGPGEETLLGRKNKDKSPLDLFVSAYADSINNFSIIGELPSFLAETQFDYQHTGIFSSFHQPISLRKIIIDNVTNCVSLEIIMKDQKGLYKRKPEKNHDIDIDFIEFSIYELAKRRSVELNCK